MKTFLVTVHLTREQLERLTREHLALSIPLPTHPPTVIGTCDILEDLNAMWQFSVADANAFLADDET